MAQSTDPRRSLSERFKDSRFVRVLLIYLGVSWPILGVAGTLQDVLLLPDWFSPATLVVLLIGLVVVLATAWIRSSPLLEKLAGVVPESWVTGWHDVVGDLRVGRVPRVTWGRSLAAVFFVVWLVFGFGGAYVLVSGHGRAILSTAMAAEEAAAGLAVLPFTASGADSELYGEGMVSVLSTTLDGVGGLRAIDSRTVLARWDEAVEDDAAPDMSTVLEVARAAGARYALAGSAVDMGTAVQLIGELYDTRTGEKLASIQARGSADSAMAVVDRLSVEAARALLREVGGDGTSVQHLDGLMTGSLPALEAYLEGERHYRAGNFDEALLAYERAIQVDSTFALASLRAWTIYGWEGSNVSRSDRREHLERAARHAGRLPPSERALVTAVDLATEDPAAAIARLERDTRVYPADPELWQALGELSIHEGKRVLEPEAKGVAALKRAIELQPEFAPYYIHVTQHAISHGDSAEAARWLARERELARDELFTRAHLHAFTLVHGDSAARAAVLDTLRAMKSVPGYTTSALHGPRRLQAREVALRAAVEQNAAPRHLRDLGFTLANQGKLSDLKPWGRVMPAVLGLIEPPDLDAGDEFYLPLSALAAASDGLTAAFQERRERLREQEESLREARPGQAEGVAVFRRFATAIATLREGRPEEAVPLLESSLEEMRTTHFVGTALYLLGDAHDRLGKEGKALDYFRVAAEVNGPQMSLALLRAARLYDLLGQADEAAASYRDLVVAWQDADPYFRPWVDEARRALLEP